MLASDQKNEQNRDYAGSVSKGDRIGGRAAGADISKRKKMRGELLKWMKQTGDPAFEALRAYDSPQALEKFMAEQDARAGQKRAEEENAQKHVEKAACPLILPGLHR